MSTLDRNSKWILLVFLSLCIAVYGFVSLNAKEFAAKTPSQIGNEKTSVEQSPANEKMTLDASLRNDLPEKSLDKTLALRLPEQPSLTKEKKILNPQTILKKTKKISSKRRTASKEILDSKTQEHSLTPKSHENKEQPIVEFAEVKRDELLLKIDFGFGGHFINLRQSGAFGTMKSSFLSVNELSIENEIIYEKYSLKTGFQRMTALFATSTADTSLKEEKIFNRFYITTGIGSYYTGLNFQTEPLMYASGTSLLWSDVNKTSVLLGLREEKIYTKESNKPFKVGFDMHASYVVSADGGSAVNLSSPQGFSLSLLGYAEKSLRKNENYHLSLGFEPGLSYEQFTAEGNWNNSAGKIELSIIHIFSRLYLGVNF